VTLLIIACIEFIIQKHNSVFQELVDIQDELEAVEIERQTLEEQVNINNQDIESLRHELKNG